MDILENLGLSHVCIICWGENEKAVAISQIGHAPLPRHHPTLLIARLDSTPDTRLHFSTDAMTSKH